MTQEIYHSNRLVFAASPVTQEIDVNNRAVLEFKTQRLLKAFPVTQEIDVNNRLVLRFKT